MLKIRFHISSTTLLHTSSSLFQSRATFFALSFTISFENRKQKRKEIFIIVTTTDDYQYKLIFCAHLMYKFTPNLSLLMNNSGQNMMSMIFPLQYSYMYLGCDLSHSFISFLFCSQYFFIRFIRMKLIHLLYVM
jgi:hypothetical protein